MKDAYRLRDQLVAEVIKTKANQLGFSNFEAMEKWIMDFEACHLLRKFIPDSIIRGGMAVPFHLRDVTGRLSVDVDAVTKLGRQDTEKLAGEMFSDKTNIFSAITLHKPKDPRKNLPLLTYFCKYESVVGAQKPEIKIDLFYGATPPVPTKIIPPPSRAVGVDIDFELEVYDYYPLIGDKLTTLAFDTIGLDVTDPNVPKHIHDIASLVKFGGNSISMSQVRRAFENSSKVEITYVEKSKQDIASIYGDLANFYQRLLRPSLDLGLDKSYAGRFDTFANSMLSRSQKRPQMHTTDVMTVSVLVEALVLMHGKKISDAKAGEIVNDAVSELDRIRSMSSAESGARARELRSRHKKGGATDYERVKTSPADQVYLYNCMLDMKDF